MALPRVRGKVISFDPGAYNSRNRIDLLTIVYVEMAIISYKCQYFINDDIVYFPPFTHWGGSSQA